MESCMRPTEEHDHYSATRCSGKDRDRDGDAGIISQSTTVFTTSQQKWNMGF
ncbi:hypothetical protein PVAG01_03166 [Phlyctema vagabunda]|uniref:Uncharacterized protein n=1 Tax=Phlyctema vagabunda TaxID=108571 RepID=A0ABR4PSR8_9HELO